VGVRTSHRFHVTCAGLGVAIQRGLQLALKLDAQLAELEAGVKAKIFMK